MAPGSVRLVMGAIGINIYGRLSVCYSDATRQFEPPFKMININPESLEDPMENNYVAIENKKLVLMLILEFLHIV